MVNFWDSKVERIFNAFPNMFATLIIIGMIYMFIANNILTLNYSFVYNSTIFYFLGNYLVTNTWFIHRSKMVVSSYTSLEIFIHKLLYSFLGLIGNFVCCKLSELILMQYFEVYIQVGVAGYVLSIFCILLYVTYSENLWHY